MRLQGLSNMLIALTHNLQLDSRDEDEAEFDRPETIAYLVDRLRELGHEVEPVEVGGPIRPGGDNPFASLRATDDQPLLSKSPGADASAGPFDLGELTDDDEKEVEAVDAPLIPDTGITFGESDQVVQGIETTAGATGGLEEEGPGDEETMRIIREIEPPKPVDEGAK